MTARSKVTLVEASQIRAHLVNTVVKSNLYHDEIADAVDALLGLGLIDTDAALRSALTPKNTEADEAEA